MVSPNSSFKGLIEQWYQAGNHSTTPDITKLCQQTEAAADRINSLLQEGKPETAKKLAEIVLKTFDSHSEKESETLALLIAHHSKKYDGEIEGAYRSIHKLFMTIARVKENDLKPTYWLTIADTQLTTLMRITSLALKATPTFEFPKEITDRILKEASALSFESRKAIDTVSKETHKQGALWAQSYLGKLSDIDIDIAEKAISYVKKFGKHLEFLDISGISFTEKEFEELTKHLPNLKSLIAQNSNFDDLSLKPLSKLNQLNVLDLSKSIINVKSLVDISSIVGLKELYLDFANNGASDIVLLSPLQNLIKLEISNVNLNMTHLIFLRTRMPNIKELIY